jgi:hypothetical protein
MSEKSIHDKLDSVVQEAATELGQDLNLIKAFWKTYKDHGVKGLAKDFPGLWDEIKFDKKLVKEIKEANENPFFFPEFFLIAGFILFNAVYLFSNSDFVSSHINAPIAAILSVYTLANTYERVRRNRSKED